jgi:hypothetical protein
MKRRPTIRQVLEDFVSATSGKHDDWLLWRLREIREQGIVALREGKGAPPDETWNSIETIPRDRKVLVKTVNGLERIAGVSRGAGMRHGRIHCWRRDGRTGDLQAVAWKEIEPGASR